MVNKNREQSEAKPKKKVDEEQEDDGTLLVPLNEYLKAGIHIGTKFKTKYMDNFIYKARPDGLYILNLSEIDNRIKLVSKLLSSYEPEDIIVVSRRENGWKPLKKLAQTTGIKVFTGRYPPGIFTNIDLENYLEAKVLVVTDPWADKNAINDAIKAGMVIIGLCDTNNESNKLDFVVPCNNKGKKSLAVLMWLVAREYLKARGTIKDDSQFQDKIDDWIQE